MKHIKRQLQVPSQSFFLFGPRGSGKSTWLKDHFNGALWIDLLLPEEERFYAARPERLIETIQGNPGIQVIIIDEVQKIPELIPPVHHLIEKKLGHQFILTGSSTRKLRQRGANFLGGRALLKYMHPFTAAELASYFKLEKALEIGMLPLIWDSPNQGMSLKSYTALYLKEEIQAEGMVRNISNFHRFLEVISFSHASIINLNNIAQECGISRSSVSNYLQILEEMLLGFTLNVFTRRAQRALVAHPKFYLFDAGVYRAIRPSGPLDRPEEVQGAALEGLVAQHLRAWITNQIDRYDLSFWRTREGAEVDFIIYGPKGFWAIEVKNGSAISPMDLKSLKSFKSEYPEASLFFLYRGNRRLMQDGILCLPVEEFLTVTLPGLL